MLYLAPAAVEALLAIRPQEAVINPGASVFGLSASLAGASMCACFCCCSLLARPADRQLQPVGQLPAVPGADGALGCTVIRQPTSLPCSSRCAFLTVPPVTVKAWSRRVL